MSWSTSRNYLLGVMMLVLPISAIVVVLLPVAMQQKPMTPPMPPQVQQTAPMPSKTEPPPKTEPSPKKPTTDAERIANARDSIKRATLALQKIQTRLNDPNGEYHKAEAEFGELNKKLKDTKEMVAKLKRDGKAAEAAALEKTVPAIEEDWQFAKERFDIAIRQKKASQESMTELKARIAADQAVLDRLEGTGKSPSTAPPPTQQPPTSPPPKAIAKEKEPSEQPSAAEAPKSLPGVPALGTVLPMLPAAPPATAIVSTSDNTTAEQSDPIVSHTRDRLDAERTTLRDVEARVRIAEERVRVMERSIQSAEKSRELEQESAALCEKSVAKLTNTLQTPPPETDQERDILTKKLAEAQERLAASRTRIARITDRVATMKETLVGLQDELNIVNKEAEECRGRVAGAEAELKSLLSPTSPRNLYRWAVTKGPRLLLIVGGMLLVHILVRQFSRHFVRFIIRHSERGSPEDRENRANTLVGVFRYAAGLVVFGGGIVMLLDEVGVPVVPLMGGAAVLGLAVAFGAQNLIRDYFTGFMMLMEDQYSVNDVVKIGTIAGLVEQITLRMTVLRDLEGTRHFIPHGTVTSVSNLTHGWSRAMLDIPVSYKENVDRVINVLMELGREMRHDPLLGKHIIEDPEMLGVDAMSDCGVVVKFLLKTRPLQQWPVKREMLRRIKNRFDELGIEIPVPHRMVYYRNADAMEMENDRRSHRLSRDVG